MTPKVLLKSDPAAGTILFGSETQLAGVPAEAWACRLGNRNAPGRVLDQHKRRTPTRDVRVSVETVAIIRAMRGDRRAA